jgi:hypothetical protein
MSALHCEVPVAAPVIPAFVDQAMRTTPTLSVAVPENRTGEADVEMVVSPGVVMAKVGAVLSAVTGCCRLTDTDWDTCAVPNEAVTVMVFGPKASSMLGTD